MVITKKLFYLPREPLERDPADELLLERVDLSLERFEPLLDVLDCLPELPLEEFDLPLVMLLELPLLLFRLFEGGVVTLFSLRREPCPEPY